MQNTVEDVDNIAAPTARNYSLDYELGRPLQWLKAGVSDMVVRPGVSIAYGIGLFVLSIAIIFGVFQLDLAYFLLPCLAGFMVMGPALATGLYRKSQLLAEGKAVSFREILRSKTASTGQILFIGVMLLLLAMLWLRSAFLLYALFFGLLPFSGFEQTLHTVFSTPLGWALLFVGSAVGGLFAAFAFAISAFSIPMLLDRRLDAFTAMGTSMAIAWNNKGLMVVWGTIVVSLFGLSLLTGLLGMIVVFPILGHATWHAYQDCWAKVQD